MAWHTHDRRTPQTPPPPPPSPSLPSPPSPFPCSEASTRVEAPATGGHGPRYWSNLKDGAEASFKPTGQNRSPREDGPSTKARLQ